MERSVDETAAPRFRTFLAGTAGGWEVIAVAVLALVAWRLTLGWDWSSVPTDDPVRTAAPQSDLDWLMLAVVVVAGVGWLARRDRAVAGALMVWAPIILLSGWRLGASGTVGWPISFASLIFVMSALCTMAACAGAWLRHRAKRRGTPAGVIGDDFPVTDGADPAGSQPVPSASSHP